MNLLNIAKIEDYRDYFKISIEQRIKENNPPATRQGLNVQSDECVVGVIHPSLKEFVELNGWKSPKEILE